MMNKHSKAARRSNCDLYAINENENEVPMGSATTCYTTTTAAASSIETAITVTAVKDSHPH